MKKVLLLAIIIGMLTLITAASAQLPSTVTGIATYPSTHTNSYVQVWITSGGNATMPDSPPYYAGWCVDPATALLNNQVQTWQVYSTVNPLPAFIPPANWNAINWLLNNDGGYDAHVIQSALFNLDNYNNHYWLPVNKTQVASLVTAAEANSSFVPGTGQLYGVILWNGPRYQDTLISLYVPLKVKIPVPEFPSAVLPAAMVIGVIGAVLFVRRLK